VRFVVKMRGCCCNLSGGVALIVWFTTNGMCLKNNTIIYVARASNSKRDCEHDLYCCLLPRCEALRTCRSGFPIASTPYESLNYIILAKITICTMKTYRWTTWSSKGCHRGDQRHSAHHSIYSDWKKRSRLASPKFLFALVLTGIIAAQWRYNKWEVLMITSLLLSNVRHRAVITPVSPLLIRIIHISPSYSTFYLSFEIILEMGTVHWVGLQIQCSMQIHCFKNIQSDMNSVSKIQFCKVRKITFAI